MAWISTWVHKKMEDWCKGLLTNYYKDSPSAVLLSVYSEHETSGCCGSLQLYRVGSGRIIKTTGNTLIGLELNLDTRRWIIGTTSRRKMSLSSEDRDSCLDTTTTHLPQHCPKCIQSTIGDWNNLFMFQQCSKAKRDDQRKIFFSWKGNPNGGTFVNGVATSGFWKKKENQRNFFRLTW